MKNIDIINLNEYERINPTELLNQGGKFHTNGVDNEFFYKTESLFLSSPTNAAIIKKYVNLILGDGLVVDGEYNDKLDRIFPKKELRLFIQDYKIHGNAALRIRYDYNGNIAKVNYIPTRCIAINIEEDIMDEPTSYWENFDWNSHKYRPREIPAFGSIYDKGVVKTEEVAYLKSPSPQPIFSLPDSFSSFQYAEMEQELSNFFIKHITTGFSGATVININQGNTLKEGEDEKIKNRIIRKLTGTSGDRVIVSINDNKENATSVENLQITDAYQQYQFVSEHSREMIMMSHQVNDPGLFGLPNSTGFSSDSEKIIQSRKDLYRDVINPMREEILEFILNIFPEYDIEFKDFEEFDKNETVDEEYEEDINLKKKDEPESVDTKNIDEFIEKGEVIDLKKWRLVDIDEEMELIDKINLNVDTGIARTNDNSSQDVDSIYKIRYRYDGNKSPEREFCRKMMAANKLYRYEDIQRMRLSNTQFSPKGAVFGYDVAIWKGGVNCKHYWVREIYANSDRTKGVDPNNPNAVIISPTKLIKESGVVPELMDPRMWVAPNDMPGKGRLN